ncbi:FimD/PapC N-terminal domain-containing protein [Escherichia coli]
MTAFRAAFKAYRMHQVLIMPRFARLTIALGLATAVFPVDAEYYFNPRFLSNDLAESVDLSAFTKGREAPPGTYRVDIYLNDEFMTSRDITFIADDNNAELIPCLSTDLLVSLGIKKIALYFALAMPDREASAVPLTQLDLAVHVATKLNRSHLLTARHSYILPVLGRSEIDMQKSGAQAVTVEDSMSMIHASRGVLKPAGVMLKSECAVVAGIAQAALPQSVVAWEYLVEDYDRIRNDIEAVLPEFADYNQRIRHPGGFHLINAAAERRWMTPSGKANFITSKGLLEDPSSAFNSKLVMATVRSHDQYNTTIYGMDDRYRGVFGQRDVVFMSAKQAKICRVKNGERVNLIALTPDGKRSSRRMDRLKVVIYPMADRSLVTYFPESNHMLTLDNHDPLSGIPGYKSIPVELEPSN